MNRTFPLSRDLVGAMRRNIRHGLNPIGSKTHPNLMNDFSLLFKRLLGSLFTRISLPGSDLPDSDNPTFKESLFSNFCVLLLSVSVV